MRLCEACAKPLGPYRGRGRPPLYHPDCNKAEVAAKQRAYYEANKAELAAKKRAYYEANKAEVAARRRAYYEANKAELAARRRAYYEANKAEVAAKKRAYREANKADPISRVLEREARSPGIELRCACGGAYTSIESLVAHTGAAHDRLPTRKERTPIPGR